MGGEHLERAARALRIEPDRWMRVLERYAGLAPGSPGPAEARLRALRAAYAAEVPEAMARPGAGPARPCPACSGGWVAPLYARASPASGQPPLFVYGRCGDCGHGLLLSEPEPESLYRTAAYFERRNASGAGYSGYEAERDYRVAKGARLLGRIAELSGRPFATMLEVGSGFGFTRAAATALGVETMGIDPNPAAAEAAARLHGLDTHVGTLDSAAADGAVGERKWDLVLYDFVLEHLADPAAELERAAALLSPAGILALTVPNMAAAEVEVFGGGYRSFRSDHRHVFSPRSLGRLMERAGLEMAGLRSGCTVHLVRGVLTEGELSHLYSDGKGPDLTVVARLARH